MADLNPARAIQLVARIEQLCDFVAHPAIEAAVQQGVPFPMPKAVPIGTRCEVAAEVKFEHTLTFHLAALPPVLTTPDMIRLMEMACYRALEPFHEGDETNVGTAIHVRHLAPAGVGAKVRAEAVLEAVNGRFYVMRCRAWHEEKLIGEGTVERSFVSVGRFMGKTQTAD